MKPTNRERAARIIAPIKELRALCGDRPVSIPLFTILTTTDHQEGGR